MNTIFYLIRHSIRLKKNDIESINSSQSDLINSEKIVLSIEGEKRAEILSNISELQNVDRIYSSNCVRTIQTAKYLMNKLDLKLRLLVVSLPHARTIGLFGVAIIKSKYGISTKESILKIAKTVLIE